MKRELTPGSKVAVIGSGVAGIVSAYLLDRSQRYRVTLFEADSRLGGHTSTVVIKRGEDEGLAVDTGFIVLNDRTYPLFTEFLNQLAVPIRSSDMSFSFEDRGSGFVFAGTTLNGLFAQRTNIFSPQFYHLLGEIMRFGKEGQHFLRNSDSSATPTLREFVEAGRYSNFMRDCYLLPISAAIWSAPLSTILDFPARSFLSFFSNHGLLSVRHRPVWQTVVNGSHQYLKAFASKFSGTIKLDSRVVSIARAMANTSQVVTTANGERQEFDAVIIATHADQALRMLKDPSLAEQSLLGSWRYQRNDVVLHTDKRQLPNNRRAWASWNYIREQDADAAASVSVTYHMNRLQGLKSKKEYCVTLNAPQRIAEGEVVTRFVYEHPVYDAQSVATQQKLTELQGVDNRYFCGSYFGYGFHEDAVRSAVEVSRLLGVQL